MKIIHHRAFAMLGDYAAGELSSTTYQAMTEHLQTCATCRKNLAEIEKIRTSLRSFALPDASVEQKSAAFSSLLEQSEWKERVAIPGQMVSARQRPSVRRSPILLVATFLAIMLLASVVIIFTFTTFQPPAGEQPHPQQHCLTLPFTRIGDCTTPPPAPTPTTILAPTPTTILAPTPTTILAPTPTTISTAESTAPPAVTPTSTQMNTP